jgi:hypothetical protein
VIAGILRTIYLAQMQRSSDDDKTWIGFNTVVAGIAEGNIGIVCACAPSLHHVFKRFFGAVTTIVGSSSSGQYPSFVSPFGGSRSRSRAGHQLPSTSSRTGEMTNGNGSGKQASGDEGPAQSVVEAYEWQQKGGWVSDGSGASEKVAPVFSHSPSRFRTLEQRMGEPRSFLHGATDDEEESVHYSEGW